MKQYMYLSAVILTLFMQGGSCTKCMSEIDAEIQATLSQIQTYKARVLQIRESQAILDPINPINSTDPGILNLTNQTGLTQKEIAKKLTSKFLLTEQDFDYIKVLYEYEGVRTPQNKILKELDKNPTTDIFTSDWTPWASEVKLNEVQAVTMHDMLQFSEEETILYFDYMVIKPVGFQTTALGSPLNGKGSDSINKGHIVNAGVLYIMESGLMRIVSTTGALLVEKNIAFDISPTDLDITGKIANVVSSPNPEDMKITILTTEGKVIEYAIKLERKFDDSQLTRSSDEEEHGVNEDGDIDENLMANLTEIEKRKLMKKLRREEQVQNVIYEYVISESETQNTDFKKIVLKRDEGEDSFVATAKPGYKFKEVVEEIGSIDVDESKLNYKSTFSNLILFYSYGYQNYIFVQTKQFKTYVEQRLVMVVKDTLFTVDLPEEKGEVVQIERYTGLILVQYKNSIEFIQFEKKSLVQSVSKVALTDEILSIQHDLTKNQYVFVQTKDQVYLYDCDDVIQIQYSKWAPLEYTQKGCKFMKKVLQADSSRQLVNMKSVKNALVLYYAGGKMEVLYTKDLIGHVASPLRVKMLNDDGSLRELETLQKTHDFKRISQAKTTENSLFLSQVDNKSLLLSQYIPLPAFTVKENAYDDIFGEAKNSVFYLIFISVLLIQIFYRKNKIEKETKEAQEKMGPLEKSLLGRSPDGKALSKKQLDEIRDIDGMLGEMGNLGENMGLGDIGANFGQ